MAALTDELARSLDERLVELQRQLVDLDTVRAFVTEEIERIEQTLAGLRGEPAKPPRGRPGRPKGKTKAKAEQEVPVAGPAKLPVPQGAVTVEPPPPATRKSKVARRAGHGVPDQIVSFLKADGTKTASEIARHLINLDAIGSPADVYRYLRKLEHEDKIDKRGGGALGPNLYEVTAAHRAAT